MLMCVFVNLLRDVARYYVTFYRANDQFDHGRSRETNVLCCFVYVHTKGNALFDNYWIPRDCSCSSCKWHKWHAIAARHPTWSGSSNEVMWFMIVLVGCFYSCRWKKKTSYLGQSLRSIRWIRKRGIGNTNGESWNPLYIRYEKPPEGVLSIMAYTGRLRPKGVPFSGFRYKKD